MEDADGLEEVIRDIADPAAVMNRVVEAALALIPSADGSVIELVRDGTLVYAYAAGSLAGHVGIALSVEESLSGRSIRTGQILLCDDAAADDRVDLDACRRVGAISMICVPLRRASLQVGVLKVTAARPRAFTGAHVDSLARLARFVSWVVSAVNDLAVLIPNLYEAPQHGGDTAQRSIEGGNRTATHSDVEAMSRFVGSVLRPGLVPDADKHHRVMSVLAEGSLRIVCQPIYDIRSGEIVGAEALARFPGDPPLPPDIWFQDAYDVGQGIELELEAFDRALDILNVVPPHLYLAINAAPRTVEHLASSNRLENIDCERVVVELTEHQAVDDYATFTDVLLGLKSRGIRIAIDDTGSGQSTLTHILRLAPDILKLDRVLTSGIDVDPVRRALAGALITFAGETGAIVVAEGIENQDELDTIRRLGIQYGQGYHLARPAPPESLHSPTAGNRYQRSSKDR